MSEARRVAIASARIVTPEGVRPGAVLTQGGIILEVLSPRGLAALKAGAPDVEIIDHGDALIMAGLVDTHVHINEPGRTDWEGFRTATQAAAAGGITTVVDMPLNCIPVTTSLKAFQEKLAHVGGQLFVDCAFHGGVIPGNAGELQPMMAAGIRSFKAFLCDSGIPEFPQAHPEDLDAALPILGEAGALLLAHAELIDPAVDQEGWEPRESYAAFLRSRPASFEDRAVDLMIAKSRAHRAPVHIVHLSSAGALPALTRAKGEGVDITAETCPHYLTLAAEGIPDGDGRFKCCPPIRSQANQEMLWAGLDARSIDFIVSDHSPCTPALKRLPEADLRGAWGGISGLQFGLSLMWTHGRARGLSLERLSHLMSAAPAARIGLGGRKGALKPGLDADLVVWDPDAAFTIEPAMIRHKNTPTAYEGQRLYGAVSATYLRGQRIFPFPGPTPTPKGMPLL